MIARIKDLQNTRPQPTFLSGLGAFLIGSHSLSVNFSTDEFSVTAVIQV